MNSIKFFLRTFFGFSAREVNGFILMAFVMVLFLVTPPIFDLLSAPTASNMVPIQSAVTTIQRDTVFSFNPNSAAREQLLLLGFQEKLADRLLKFRNAKGQFRTKSDLLKLYGMDTLLYQKLQDSIIIEPRFMKTHSMHQVSNVKKTPYQFPRFNINECDSIQLEKLRGIGPTLASRILKYRQKLGGFIDTAQYKEVYGLKEFALEELKRCTFIAKDFSPNLLRINSCTVEELGKHPYVGWKAAKILVLYRSQHGAYSSMQEVQNSKALNEDALKKIATYISWK